MMNKQRFFAQKHFEKGLADGRSYNRDGGTDMKGSNVT